MLLCPKSVTGSDRMVKNKQLRDTSDYCGLTNLLLPKKEEKKEENRSGFLGGKEEHGGGGEL